MINGNPKLTGYVIALLMLGGFLAIIQVTMQNLKNSRIVQDLRDQNVLLEQRAMDYEQQVVELKAESSLIESKAKEAASIKERFQTAIQKQAAITEEILEIENTRNDLLAQARAEKSRLLATAKNKKLDVLTTASGKEYKNVEITQATLVGMRINHSDGTANIPPKELPKQWRHSLGYDIIIPDISTPASDDPPPVQAQPTVAKEIPTRLNDPEGERKILEDTVNLDKAAQFRALARRYHAEAEKQDAQALVHDQKANAARMANRPSMQAACATKAREIAAGLRAKATQATNAANSLASPPP